MSSKKNLEQKLNNKVTGSYYMHCPNPTGPEPTGKNLYSMSGVMIQNVTVNEYKIMSNVLLTEYLSIN